GQPQNWESGDSHSGGSAMVKARSLIDGAAFGPEAVKAIGQAFDEAWDEIGGYFAGDPITRESARLNLATAILSVATETSRDVRVLKKAALQVLAGTYTSLSMFHKERNVPLNGR